MGSANVRHTQGGWCPTGPSPEDQGNQGHQVGQSEKHLVGNLGCSALEPKLGRVTEAERAYRSMIHRVPGEEIDERKLGQTLRMTKGLMVTGVLMIAAMVVFYARPYAAGRGASAPESATLEIGSGENER